MTIFDYFLGAWLVCIAGAALYVTHKILLKTFRYRWLFHSITYLYNSWLTRKFVKNSEPERIRYFLESVEEARPWNYNTWFGKALRAKLYKALK